MEKKTEEYWPMFDDGGSNGHGDGNDEGGLPPWLVFLMLAMFAWMLSRALAM